MATSAQSAAAQQQGVYRDMKLLGFKDSVKAVLDHYRQGNLNWPMVIYIGLVHVAAVVGVLSLPFCQWQTLLFAFLLWPITGLGITAGVHRMWAHRSYNASLPLRIFLMLVNSMANQGSIYHWSRDHRVHHKHSETDADPHNATRGFFFAHMGWLLVKKHPDVIAAGKQLDFSDLEADPVVMFQKRLDPWFALFMCFVFPGLVCTLWGDSFWHGYWVAGALRYCWVLHCTWLVNSAAHFQGDHPYDPDMYPAENPLVSIAAIGEGWHNWHHKYPFDYACSEFGVSKQYNPNPLVSIAAIGEGWHNWHHKYPFDYACSEFGVSKQYNPTKMFIDAMCALGLASDRKRATGAWNKLKQKRAEQIRNETSKKEN